MFKSLAKGASIATDVGGFGSRIFSNASSIKPALNVSSLKPAFSTSGKYADLVKNLPALTNIRRSVGTIATGTARTIRQNPAIIAGILATTVAGAVVITQSQKAYDEKLTKILDIISIVDTSSESAITANIIFSPPSPWESGGFIDLDKIKIVDCPSNPSLLNTPYTITLIDQNEIQITTLNKVTACTSNGNGICGRISIIPAPVSSQVTGIITSDIQSIGDSVGDVVSAGVGTSIDVVGAGVGAGVDGSINILTDIFNNLFGNFNLTYTIGISSLVIFCLIVIFSIIYSIMRAI